MFSTVAAVLSLSYTAHHHTSSAARRCSVALLAQPQTSARVGNVEVPWRFTKSGLKYVDEEVGEQEVGADAVVKVHYNIFLLDSGRLLGGTRGTQDTGRPLTFKTGQSSVPIFDDAIEGMRIGSKRRVLVPPSAIPDFQRVNIPKGSEDEMLRFDIELVGTESGLQALIPSLLPPANRRVTILRAIFLLSFLPYLLPEDVKPDLYRGGDVQAISAAKQAARESASLSRWLGGDGSSLDSLFPTLD